MLGVTLTVDSEQKGVCNAASIYYLYLSGYEYIRFNLNFFEKKREKRRIHFLWCATYEALQAIHLDPDSVIDFLLMHWPLATLILNSIIEFNDRK